MEKAKMIFILMVIVVLCFSAFGKQKVLDLGEIEIIGEVRRPNVNLVHSKKYFNKIVSGMIKDELEEFEKELLEPVKVDLTERAKK